MIISYIVALQMERGMKKLYLLKLKKDNKGGCDLEGLTRKAERNK